MVAAAPERQIHGQGMKILITGAGGMLGSDLVGALAGKHVLTGVGRRPAPHLGIPFHLGDLGRSRVAADLIEKERPEVVLHAAAMTDVDRCETERREALLCNFEATANVCEAVNRTGALLILFSTDFVFDGAKSGPYEEDDIPHPISVYGESKHLAERYLLMKGKRFLIVRSSWLFGKQGNNFPRKILQQAEAGKTLEVVSDQFGSPTYTVDLAQATSQIVERIGKAGEPSGNQIYHITNEGIVSRYEWARMILEKKHFPVSLVKPVTSEVSPRPAARPRNSALSNEKVKTRFGIELRSWQEALEAYFQEDSTLPNPGVSCET
jgi:dTDP-4-dehydrorhamnose reductase